MRNRFHRGVAAIATQDIAETVATFIKGGLPPNSRQIRASHPGERRFRIDHDDYSDEEMRRDLWYQEVLRPLGFFWHANICFAYEPGEELHLSLKRKFALGPYDRQDATVLNSLVADLETALRISRRVLDAEASGMVRMLHQRGDPVFELDAWGRVLRVHADGGENAGICSIGRRLVADDRLAQAAVDRAVMNAVTPPSRPVIASITDRLGERRILQILPVAGRARDVFL